VQPRTLSNNTCDMYNFNKINELFDVRSLLQTKNPIRDHLGIKKVEMDEGTNSRGSKAVQLYVEDANGKQRILLYDIEKASGKQLPHFLYSNRTYARDKGDVVQFIANRLPSRKIRDAVGLLHKYEYQKNAALWKKREEFEIKRAGAGRKRSDPPFVLDDFMGLRPITQLIENEKPHYLEKRYISNDILEIPNFTDQVFVYTQTDRFKNVHENIFFPKREYGSDTISGAEVKTPYHKDYSFGDHHLLWSSNIPDEVHKIVVTESALDALSHYQLSEKDNANTWYFSTGGNFYPERQRQFFSMIGEAGLDRTSVHLISAMDNDLEGFNYDLSLLNETLAAQSPGAMGKGDEFYGVSHEGGKPSLRFMSHDQGLLNEASSHFLLVADHLNQGYLKNRENHFCEIRANNDHVSLVFPAKEKLSRVAKSLSVSISKNIKVLSLSKTYIHKPKIGKDWNDTLAHHAKEQLSRSAKHSLSKKYSK